jgi:hypothetical protein
LTKKTTWDFYYSNGLGKSKTLLTEIPCLKLVIFAGGSEDKGHVPRNFGFKKPNYLIPGWYASKSLYRPVRRSFNEDIRPWSAVAYHCLFGGKIPEARRLYLEFVKKGVAGGRRPDLTGDGLAQSTGGWSALKTMRKGESRMKGDGASWARGNSLRPD